MHTVTAGNFNYKRNISSNITKYCNFCKFQTRSFLIVVVVVDVEFRFSIQSLRDQEVLLVLVQIKETNIKATYATIIKPKVLVLLLIRKKP